MKLGYKTKKGNTHWSSSTVCDILKNVKYKGDLVLGKTYTLDPILYSAISFIAVTD
jgi:hypothetical protein